MILCLLLPGFGYVRSGRMKGFYITIMGLFLVLAGGSVFRLFPDFSGFIMIISVIAIIHFGTAFHCIFHRNVTRYSPNRMELSVGLTAVLLLITSTCFGNSARTMGFDRVFMAVPVMEPFLNRPSLMLNSVSSLDLVVFTLKGINILCYSFSFC